METANEQAQSTNSAEQTQTQTAAATAETTQKGVETKATTGTTEQKTVPDKYSLTLPEGSQLDQTWIEKIASKAKEQGLSQEQAQAELNERSEMLSSYAEAQRAAMQKQSDAWLNEVKSDKELGGESFNKTAEIAKFAVDNFLGPKVKQFLDETGLGNHPELVRAFYKIGTQLRNDSLVRAGSAPGGQQRSIEEYFYNKT